MIRSSKMAYPGCPLSRSLVFGSFRLSAFVLLFALWAWLPVQAQDRDSEFLGIYSSIQAADTLDQAGQTAAALTKYRQAQAALQKFRLTYPDWDAKVVSFRASYLSGKIAELSNKLAPAAPAASESGTNHAAAATSSSANSPSASKVKLLEAGTEPRKVLRLHPKPGDKQTVNMTMKMSMEMNAGETKVPALKMPTLTMVMDFDVKSVTAEGNIGYEFVITDATVGEEAGVMPQIAEAFKAALGNLKGLSGKASVSDRGVTRGIEFKLAAGADPSVRQATEQLKEAFSSTICPLPEEAVGAGAKWQVRKPVKSEGMTIDETTTYELASFEEERITLKTTVAQSAANQKISNPAMPGLKLDVTKMTGSGSGEVTWDLSQLAPRAGNVEEHSELALAMNTGGQKQEMTMARGMNVHIESK